MRRTRVLTATLLAVWAFAALPAAASAQQPSVLVFSATGGFRHDSIATGVATIRQLGAAHGFGVVATEDPGVFSGPRLAPFAAVVWLNTSGDVLDDAQQAAFERYVEGGGGYVGVHAAADTEYGWPWYGKLVGAHFASHPPVQAAAIDRRDAAHPSTADLPSRWTHTDEYYDYAPHPRANGVHVLLSVDEATYGGGGMGADHPITWCQHVGAGRSWYTGLGHTAEAYGDARFRTLLLGGIRTAAGLAGADCAPSGGSANLARGRPVTTSSVENGTLDGANAVDGDPATRWSSAWSDPQWLRVDLGAQYALGWIRLHWEAWGSAYEVQVSEDGSTYRTVFATTSGDGGTDTLLRVRGTGRYVRVLGTRRASPYGYSLREIEVHGSPAVTAPYGTYRLVNRGAGGQALHQTDEPYAGVAGTRAVVTTPLGWRHPGQRFVVSSAGWGWLRLTSAAAPANRLHTTGERYGPFADVFHVASTPAAWAGSEQEWRIEDAGGGWYRFVNRARGTALQATGDRYGAFSDVFHAAGSPTAWGIAEQQWRLEPE